MGGRRAGQAGGGRAQRPQSGIPGGHRRERSITETKREEAKYKVQSREHLFRNCPQRTRQQKTPRTEVRKETGRDEGRFKFHG